ncbi:MAG TPA: ATP-binding protein [Phycisphaerae bacterium]|nr:ATP-binding protein [Phycisphaerae bacterium]
MPTLQVLQGPDKGQVFKVVGERTIIGRYSEHVHLTDHTVSRRHAELQQRDDAWRIHDLGSSNGTYVNGERVDGSSPLRHNVQIKVGGTLMVFLNRATVKGYNQPAAPRDFVDVDSRNGALDSAILSAIQSGDESMILASPETADAVHAWNLMYQLAEAVGTISSVDDLLGHATEIILRHMPVDRVFILMRTGEGEELEPVAVRYRVRSRHRSKRITVSKRMIQQVMEQREGVLCANAGEQLGREDLTASLQQLALRSVVCVPIVGHERVQGVIHLDTAMTRHTYTHEHLRVATAIGRLVGLAIENHDLTQARVRSARLAAMGETVAYLSHHIRNMLQGLRSGADVLEAGLHRENQENVQVGWRIVQNNLERIYHLASNMLTFSKDREPRIEMIELNAIIEELLTLAQRQATERGVTLVPELGDVPAVPADADGVHQAVLNLVLNAIVACPPNTGRVTVRTRYESVGNEVMIAVCDNGSGIPPERRSQVFQAFQSSKGQGGTGLGLAAAKKIVDELAGSIEVQSSASGTCFTIHLPAERTATADLSATRAPAHEPFAAPDASDLLR